MNPSKSELCVAEVCLYLRPVLLPEPTHMQCGKLAGSVEASSPTQSDEEYLSPQEEAMELGDSPALSKSVHFIEPPSFQVGGSQI